MNSTRSFRYLIISTLSILSLPAFAQTFSSNSDGSDGPLTFNTPGTWVFDPKSYPKPLNPANDGIFNFTTITIAAGVTVKLRGDILNTPVVWLAQGPVKIDGTIDLNGQDAFSAANTTQRVNTVPGAGGYAGGYPGVGANRPGAGLGPAGGQTGQCSGLYGGAGGFTGNQFLVPLVGGSGSGGSGGTSGAAGGGAILIASSVSISGSGSIQAVGGKGLGFSSSGAGGAIRLVSPSVTISGLLSVLGGSYSVCNNIGDGIVRVEAFQIGALNTSGPLHTATPFKLFVTPSGIPALSAVSVGGVPVATSPTGTFTMPDVTVNSAGPIDVAITAANVPIGTVVTLVTFSENGPDQTILSTPLVGTLASSTATATIPSLAPGFSKGFVKATF